jgi:hypothetical protein
MRVRLNQPRASITPHFAVCAGVSLCCLCLVLVCAAVVPAAFSQATPTPQKPTNQAEPKPSTLLRPEANRLPDANDIMTMREQKTTKLKFEAANTERKRQLDDDSQALLKLAADLNEDLGKNGPKPSPDLKRKLEEIERLAHSVQVKMKLTMSAPS